MAFFFFSGVMLLSAAAVIGARNPVHSVMFLILCFFNASALFIIAGAEYLAMTIMIVYVGAVAVLFLFVVMMLDINIAKVREGFVKFLPVGIAFAILIFTEIVVVLRAAAPSPVSMGEIGSTTSNTESIGNVLYTNYVVPFQISGLVLLVAMIGAIVLTHRTRAGVRRQKPSVQSARKRQDSVEIIKVKSGQGV